LDLSRLPRARLRVKHQAEVFYNSSHGVHRTGRLQLSGTLTPGVNFTNQDVGNLHTLILSACHVLDLNDYNNLFSFPFASAEHGRGEATRRHSPGRKWFDATNGNVGKPEVVLLGFNGQAAAGGMDSATIQRFFQVLGAIESSSPTDRAHAWMAANFDMGKAGVSDGFNACAWDRGHYYYIPFRRTPNGRPIPRTRTGVYRLPRAAWDATQMSGRAWFGQLPSRAGATMIQIRR
jgi:hypothetical protein